MDVQSSGPEKQPAQIWRSSDEDFTAVGTGGQLRPLYFSTPDGDAMIYKADIEEGTRLFGIQAQKSWKITKVQAYSSDMGTARDPTGMEPTRKPFHHDYRHYKYFGFAGKGAKTSWGYNPKYSVIYNELHSISPTYTSMATPAVEAPPPVPLRETMEGPRRPLTPGEKELIKFFRNHSHAHEGKPSLLAPASEDTARGNDNGDLGRPCSNCRAVA
ncbi:hypothetical protein CEUSTIGMA_g4949.t1 [Chlamydomonas eustigma]|uniref:Uncharacterized protein n=1 Tax=Chlamydomonas eustigma TaxID=1157962 RepID=A0A250X367_9CHLO|nr:hypothetical protein CEUSTIGMA_g4949.t1 [Chlamydomonas eustigma]|eukprot:GAX77505.1 hypothetical protein CEUSTIGMA_g4949.t1 [Chlamydomonas eustigma]